MSEKTKENTEEFNKLYQLLNKLAANNKDPDKVITVDTDELLRSNKPLEEVVQPASDGVPTRVLCIDDLFPPAPAPAPATKVTTPPPTTSSLSAFPTFQSKEPKESKESKRMHATSNPGAFSVTIGIDVARKGANKVSIGDSQEPMTFQLSNQEDGMSSQIGIDVSSDRKPVTTREVEEKLHSTPTNQLRQFNHLRQDGGEEGDDGQPGEEEEGENHGSKELQIGSGDPLIFQNPTCKACKKSFDHFKFLKKHLLRYPVCKEWSDTMEEENKALPKKGIHMLVEEYVHKTITGDKPFQCKFCKNVFTNTSNHHKHYHNFMACNRMAIIEFVKNIGSLVT